MRSDFVLDALKQGLYRRQLGEQGGLIIIRIRGAQHVSLGYSERLADAGTEPSVAMLADPVQQRLRRGADLAGNGNDGCPLRIMLTALFRSAGFNNIQSSTRFGQM